MSGPGDPTARGPQDAPSHDTGPGAEIDAMVAAYAFDVLEGSERAEVEELVLSSPDIALRLAEFQAALGSLGSARAVMPPLGLRDQVLSRLDDVEQLPPAAALPGGADGRGHLSSTPAPLVAPLTTGSSDGEGAGGEPPPAPSPLVPRQRRHQRRPVVAALVAAAVAAVVTLGGVGGWQLLQPRAQQQELAGALDRVNAAPDVVRVAAESTTEELAGTELVYSPSQGEAVVTSDEAVPELDGRVYVLWTLDEDGQPRHAGSFTSGGGAVVDGDIQDAAAVAVTIETEAEPSRPTTPVVARYDLAA